MANIKYHSFIKKYVYVCESEIPLRAYLARLLPTCILPKCFPAHPWPCTPVMSPIPSQGHTRSSNPSLWLFPLQGLFST